MKIKCLGSVPTRKHPIIIPQLNFRRFNPNEVHTVSEIEWLKIVDNGFSACFEKMPEEKIEDLFATNKQLETVGSRKHKR